jgi:Uma2 family endonuclease
MRGIQTPPGTIMEVFKTLPEGTLAELINGSIYRSPAPTPKHQRIVRELAFELSASVKRNNKGEIFFAPCDVFLDEELNAVQPDIIFISKEKSKIVLEDDSIHGVPDILIEVLSKGNANHDAVRKKELYQRFGVREYWIINPDTKESIGYILQDRIYTACGSFNAKIKSIVLNQEFPF